MVETVSVKPHVHLMNPVIEVRNRRSFYEGWRFPGTFISTFVALLRSRRALVRFWKGWDSNSRCTNRAVSNSLKHQTKRSTEERAFSFVGGSSGADSPSSAVRNLFSSHVRPFLLYFTAGFLYGTPKFEDQQEAKPSRMASVMGAFGAWKRNDKIIAVGSAFQ